MDDLREKVALAIARKRYSYEPDLVTYDADDVLESELAEADAVLAAIKELGHRIVPVEPTPKMVAAGDVYPIVGGSPDDVYRAMLTACGQGDKP